jgi:hypothetical protein
MQTIMLPLAGIVVLAATGEPTLPRLAETTETGRDFSVLAPPGEQCRDAPVPTSEKLTRQPRFERGPATPDEGQIIYAVDRRINGCSVVLVMSPVIRPNGEMQLSPEEIEAIKRHR